MIHPPDESIREENMRLRTELTKLENRRVQAVEAFEESQRQNAHLQLQMDVLVTSKTWRIAQVLIAVIKHIPLWARRGLRQQLARAVARLRQPAKAPEASGTIAAEPPAGSKPAIPFNAIYYGLFTQGMEELAANPWHDTAAPDVSVIILNWNRSAMTVACARYLLRHTHGYRFEIIIVDNGSRPEEIALLQGSGLPGRIIALGSNRYFGEANNIAAEQARGQYLAFLNNDAFVHEGWLEPLVAVFDRLPNVGAVGSRLLYPDGRLQEAGALMSWDGIANQLGKLSTINDAERYASIRQVDYVSAAAMLMRRQDFLDLLGFDLCWEPAYFEDVDLCLKLKTLGKPIYYCPDSVVTHVENATSLDKQHDLNLSNIIETNRSTFTARWGGYLLGSPAKDYPVALPPRTPAPAIAPPPGRKRVALFTPFFLTPGGGERYLLGLGAALAGRAEVTLVTTTRCSAMRLQRIGSSLRIDTSAMALVTLDEARLGPTFDLAFVIGNATLPPLPGLARRNVYVCQFPFPMREADAAAWHGNLAHFDLILVYSEFARRNFEARSAGLPRKPGCSVQVLTPPVHLLHAAPAAKKRMILSVGRFFAGHHCKRQDLMIEAFRGLVSDGTPCELHLAGSLRPETEHRAFYLSIVHAAKGLPVFIHPNIEPADLERLYAQSSIYWHLTGMQTDTKREPERSEHFGIAIVEAMSAGCIPVAFNSGGPAEIITQGQDGYLIEDMTQLAARTRALLDQPDLAASMRARAIAAAQKYDDAIFAARVGELTDPLLLAP